MTGLENTMLSHASISVPHSGGAEQGKRDLDFLLLLTIFILRAALQ